MTKPTETKERFIELRASGMTLTKAAEELGIARNTAINWEKDLKDSIATAKAFRLEELQAKYCMTKEKRIELFGERLQAMENELSKRDLSDVPTLKLFEMTIRCSEALKAEAHMPEFKSEEEIKRLKKARKIVEKEAEEYRANQLMYRI